MSVAEPQPAVPRPKLRWYQFSLRALLVFVLLVSIGVAALTAYFRQTRIDGGVRYAACVCGFKRAEVSNGEVILLEPNHETPGGGVVATIEIKDGTVGDAEFYKIDHLGAKCYSERYRGFVYVILADNWKLYPFAVFARIENMFR